MQIDQPHVRRSAGPVRDGTTMRAVVQDRYGPTPDVLRLDVVERPAIGADDVLVRVGAAGLDRGVWHLMAGRPYLMRLAGFGLRAPRHRVPGTELAGQVVAVGGAVVGLAPGDEVFGVGDGSFAEYTRARASALARRPTGVGVEAAATLGVSGTTALQAVRDHGRVRAGQRVLVLGASGGVGTLAVQIAVALGAEVTGVCRTAKVDLVRDLGAHHVVDYTRESIPIDRGRYDVVVDTGGNRPLRTLRAVLAPRGRLVIVGGETGGRWLGGVDRQLRAVALSAFVGQTLGTFVARTSTADLQALAELVESGAVRPVVDRTVPLAGAADAVRALLDGQVRGKVVVRP